MKIRLLCVLVAISSMPDYYGLLGLSSKQTNWQPMAGVKLLFVAVLPLRNF